MQVIKNLQPTCIHLVPPLIGFMANSPEITKNEFVSINSIMGGAAPIGEALISRLLEKAGKYFFFQEGYGLTELSPGKISLHFDEIQICEYTYDWIWIGYVKPSV